MSRQTKGLMNYHDGVAAEDCVARLYCVGGGKVAARRWRGRSGEIDLVIRMGHELVFVEVKKASDFSRAVERLTGRQLMRIARAAEEFVAQEPLGSLTPIRIDVALVNGQGEARILENVSL